LPVVTTDAGGIPFMVRDGETGFVISHAQELVHEAMAARALQLVEQPGHAELMTQRAHAECEQYSWTAVRDEWVKLYQEMNRPPANTNPNDLGKWWGKLRKMSVAEFRVRSLQALTARAERTGWSSLTSLPSDQKFFRQFVFEVDGITSGDQFLERFRTRNCAFFPAFGEREAVLAELRARWPEAEAQIVAQADRIVAGKFDLLGFKDLDFGNPINWRLEPLSGKAAPPLHWSRLDYLDTQVTGDKKIVWELNRHQHFLKLGQAYWLTRDEKYAEAFVRHLNSWMDQNPPKVGINWTSSLEVALRSISWLWAFHYFQDSAALDSQTFTRALKFLYLSGRHLETYLSTYFSPNTHLTGETLGLFYLGTLLPEFKAAARWRSTGRRILLKQLQCQVRADGVYFEQSSYYHRYTTDFYTHFLILLEPSLTVGPLLGGAPASAGGLGNFLSEPPASAGGLLDNPKQDVEQKLQALLDHLMYITRPDGSSPLIGDDDGGRLVTLDRRRANDFRAALSTGAALLGRGDYKFVAGEFAEETLWLLGARGARAFDEVETQKPAVQSKDFPYGGYYVMRDGWQPRANYLLFDCGPHGTSNCGHAHADALSIEVGVNGRPLLVDPGTYTYTGSKEQRDLFRGSSAHNVLLVDGEPSSIPAGPFSWKTIASCEPLSWISERRFDYVAGRHDGYERLTLPATHTRSILFLKNDYWIMRDRLAASGSHALQLLFHFAPEVVLGGVAQGDVREASERGEVSGAELHAVNRSQRIGLQLVFFGQEGRLSREESSVSQCYGNRETAPLCSFSAVFSGNRADPDEVITMLLPSDGERPKFKVREVEAIGGRAFELGAGDHCDLVVLKDARSERVETVRLASDFNWSWARFSKGVAGDAELLELLVIDGQHLALDGKEIVKSGKRVSQLVASRVGDRYRVETGDRYRVETNEGLLELSFPIGDLAQVFAESSRSLERSEI
jgi:hypothetical protein